jgi:hypothetical protein
LEHLHVLLERDFFVREWLKFEHSCKFELWPHAEYCVLIGCLDCAEVLVFHLINYNLKSESLPFIAPWEDL